MYEAQAPYRSIGALDQCDAIVRIVPQWSVTANCSAARRYNLVADADERRAGQPDLA
jgi:hypothetical protein